MYPIIDTQETGKRIRELMNLNGVSARDIQKYLNLACVQSVYRWLNGSNVPTIDNLYALSELFQVSIDEIVQGNRIQLKPDVDYEFVNRMKRYYITLVAA